MSYLYDHQNRHAPVRANGKRFWGYPARSKDIRIIAVHTTESLLDLDGADGGAEAVARYQSTTDRPSSYHQIVDRDSTIEMLPDGATAFGVVGYNSVALSIALAMQAKDWADPAKAAAAEPALNRLADKVADWCRRHGVPARLITKEQADKGVEGILGHGMLDPARRSDPGAHFPWARFIEMVLARLRGQTSTPLQEEDNMETLEIGSRGAAVKLLQKCLHREAHASVRKDSPALGEEDASWCDGIYGKDTARAVEVYQRGRINTSRPGVAGGVTCALLFRWENR